MKTTTQGNLFGGADTVIVGAKGRARLVGKAGKPLQLTLDGKLEAAVTLRNPFTEQREREDIAKGLTAK